MIRTILTSCLLVAASSPATSADIWPTNEDVLASGKPVEAERIGALLAGNSVIVSFSLGAATFGMILECRGDESPMLFFDSGISSFEKTRCRPTDGGFCVVESAGRPETCHDLRTLDGWNQVFLSPGQLQDEDLSPEDRADIKADPAEAVAFVPLSVEALARVEGHADFGAFALDLPEQLSLDLGYALAHPLVFSFGSGFFSGNVSLSVEQIGWPEADELPAPREAGAALRTRAERDLDAWADYHANRELSPGFMGVRYSLDEYRSERRMQDNGPCYRVHEVHSVVGDDVGITVRPAVTWFARQVCIAPGAGAMLSVTVRIAEPSETDDFDRLSELADTMLDSLRLGWASQQ